MLSDVSLTNAGKFPAKYKKAKQRIKVNAHAEEIFYFSKRGHLCRCWYLTVPLLSQPRPQGTFHWLWRWGAVTAFWASPRFGHPHSHIPSVLGIKTLIASTLPKLFQTGEKSGLLITNLRLNSVDAC